MTRERNARPARYTAAVALVLVPALALSLSADPRQGPPPAHDPLAEHLFEPDLVMRHQMEIGLSTAQRETFIEELQATQSEMVPLQFAAHEAAEALERLISVQRLDEGEVIAQAKRLMEIETRVKARHLTLLVRIKNLLSLEQQERLAAMRSGGAR